MEPLQAKFLELRRRLGDLLVDRESIEAQIQAVRSDMAAMDKAAGVLKAAAAPPQEAE